MMHRVAIACRVHHLPDEHVPAAALVAVERVDCPHVSIKPFQSRLVAHRFHGLGSTLGKYSPRFACDRIFQLWFQERDRVISPRHRIPKHGARAEYSGIELIERHREALGAEHAERIKPQPPIHLDGLARENRVRFWRNNGRSDWSNWPRGRFLLPHALTTPSAIVMQRAGNMLYRAWQPNRGR